jgi:hypothetical protein
MRTIVLVQMVLVVSLMAQNKPPQLLQLVRERVKVGSETAYEVIEDERARACAEFNCPHPFLALEPLGGPKEVWWLNSFLSETDRQRVTDEYARNGPLMAAFERTNKPKANVTATSSDLVLKYQPDLSRTGPWDPAGMRFLVVTATEGSVLPGGTVFEAPDGTRLVLHPAKTRVEAERLASEASGEITVLGVRPSWGMPAKEWIDADPSFWAFNPSVKP